jgi:Protein of unknown function (DUF3105)
VTSRVGCLLVALALAAAGCGDDKSDAEADRARAAIEGVEIITVPPYEHYQSGTPIEYDRTPPVGGDHWPSLAPCDFYDEPIDDVLAVHAIEHGAVWISYDPSLPADEIAVVRQLANANDKVLAAPYEGLDAPLVLTSWGAQLEVDRATDDRVAAFADAFVDAPAAPEAGRGC